MSKARIEQYYREVEEAIQNGGSSKESSIRRYFANLIEHYAKAKKLTLIDEMGIRNAQNQKKFPDGSLQLKGTNVGHWESKDTKDDLEKEIHHKFSIGYPQYNILFENSEKAILFQSQKRSEKGNRVMEANMKNWKELDKIISAFVNYETEEVRNFREALEKFNENVPRISKVLRAIIDISAGTKRLDDFDTAMQLDISEAQKNDIFIQKRNDFWASCKKSINPHITLVDIDEMIIQHILTENIFNTIFTQTQFHQENNISNEVSQIVASFFHKNLKSNTIDVLENYYTVIKTEAQTMKIYQEKQKFLKLIYEEFYKAYNPQGADRLGIVYTPSEIIQFMLKTTNELIDKHFDKTLNDVGVKILDPCTGTGTFICDLIEFLNKSNLQEKYENDIFANEVSILPYYIANLNIENTYKEKMSKSKTFENLAFVDTLDNINGMVMGHLGEAKAKKLYGSTGDLFAISQENRKRIERQNEQEIMIIIGNPPYNANQQNENDNNKNREYTTIDKRIKETYIKESTAQKTKLYDMYARFYRWAMDRIAKNGIVAFVTNRSFIDSRTFDGFRKCAAQDFQEIWIMDTRSDVRANPKIAGTTHNVFGIQTGVCIAFFIKNEELKDHKCKIYYHSLPDEMRKEEKLHFLASIEKLKDVPFQRIKPDEKGNWINQTDNDFEELIPVCSKEVKNGKSGEAIFELFSNGVQSNRDEWVYDFLKKNLENKIQFFIKKYNQFLKEKNKNWDTSIKWSRDLKKKFEQRKTIKFDKKLIIEANYRPFTKQFWYGEKILNDVLTQNHYDIFGEKLDKENSIICFSGISSSKSFQIFALNTIWSLDFLEKTQCLPLYRYENGERKENISDWALEFFGARYEGRGARNGGKNPSPHVPNPSSQITKIDIFHYVYAVLHNPAYRKKYEQNLKRDFPRIPLYDDFWHWAEMGKALMDLHLHYESLQGFENLVRIEMQEKTDLSNCSPDFSLGDFPRLKSGLQKTDNVGLKPKLKANKETGEIYIDEATTLSGIPSIAWEYKLGNRSALEWILDQYKESKPSDATIAEKFNTYRFADYKEQVIDLLQRVCTVSVRTMEIIQKM